MDAGSASYRSTPPRVWADRTRGGVISAQRGIGTGNACGIAGRDGGLIAFGGSAGDRQAGPSGRSGSMLGAEAKSACV